jgi:hypothetical protein
VAGEAGGIALRFPEHMRLGALTNPSRELRQEAEPPMIFGAGQLEPLGVSDVGSLPKKWAKMGKTYFFLIHGEA